MNLNLYIVSVSLSFFICWAPFHFQRMFARYFAIFNDEKLVTFVDPSENFTLISTAGVSVEEGLQAQLLIYYAVGILYYTCVALNPILYGILTFKFSKAWCKSPSKSKTITYSPTKMATIHPELISTLKTKSHLLLTGEVESCIISSAV